ncbi:hypothetical protein J6590_089001 [Homalodisca vitripennis]|nr:hypothetical protein J6590_089001 [Homalodisca vitripennis]
MRRCECDERIADLMRVGEKSKDLAAAGERLVGNKSAARARQPVHLCKLGDRLIHRPKDPRVRGPPVGNHWYKELRFLHHMLHVSYRL